MKRRDFLTLSIKSAMAAGFTSAIPLALLRPNTSHAAILAAGLSDPAAQPLFTNLVPNALAADFKYQFDANRELTVRMAERTQQTGLVDANGSALTTRVWGYGDGLGVSWPGPTFELNVNDDPVRVKWLNNLPPEKKKGKGKGGQKSFSHLLPVDINLHLLATRV